MEQAARISFNWDSNLISNYYLMSNNLQLMLIFIKFEGKEKYCNIYWRPVYCNIYWELRYWNIEKNAEQGLAGFSVIDINKIYM